MTIETVTGFYFTDGGGMLGSAFMDIRGISYAFPWVECGAPIPPLSTARRFFGFNHAVRLYVDGPAVLQFDADGGAGAGIDTADGEYSVTGYLEALP
ncbi:hypothetical protein [Streptomyces sp. UNOC14_S4]|uniref:hypothetical protein n=1 Tax=Streptomyces sp. UNOC14_S4 TaxID=2872340 RepID=UPI001E4FE953|nr:hypothetical protein [Streptomyces sp. UNOC14_S4]MCC3769542.1 hypothetical protein [Streptomyces sp. UNOC14_S4]